MKPLGIACCFLLLIGLCAADKVGAFRPLSRPPQNIAAYAGETVQLTCESAIAPPGARIIWGEQISNGGGGGIISDNEEILDHPNKDRYRIVHPSATEYHLEIRDIRLEDGGTYSCHNTLQANDFGDAQLIVLAAAPNCTSTAPADGNVLENQNFTIECIMYYQGGFSPSMTWTGPPPFNSASNPPNPTTVWSGVAYQVNRMMDTRAFECRTNFTNELAVPPTSASNLPTWSHLHRAPQIFVFWGPKNMMTIPEKPFYEVGETITCSADAHPPPSYQWQNMRTLEWYPGAVYTVLASDQGFNQSIRCQAMNLIQGFVYSDNRFISVYVPLPTTPTTPTTTPPTTTQPLESNCLVLSGQWVSETPYAELILDVIPGGQLGEVYGIMKNETDTMWIEVVGTVKRGDNALIGLTALRPFDDGVTGLVGECHRCRGEEVIITDGMWRSYKDSLACGDGGNPGPQTPLAFKRSGSVRAALDAREMKVWNPTHITKRLGVNLKK
jgi:hypothetical protein